MLVKKIMDKMVNSCKKTTELIDRKTIVPLSLKEKLQLYFHTSMCKTCKSYQHQSQFIDKAVSKLFQGESQKNSRLSKEAKQKMIDDIKKS